MNYNSSFSFNVNKTKHMLQYLVFKYTSLDKAPILQISRTAI